MSNLRLCAATAAFSAAIALAGCAPTLEQRGNLPTREEVAQIHPGTTTKDQVTKILGTPSSVGVFDSNSWYYISKHTKQVAFFLPDTTDQQVTVVDFNNKGVVEAVGHKSLKDAKAITPAPGATPAPGRELTFLEQVLGNLGRFNGGGGGGGGSGGSTRVPGGGPNGPSPNGEY